MAYSTEEEMYPDVMGWLNTILPVRFPGSHTEVHDTHRYPLKDYIAKRGLGGFFASDLWQTYDIQVDITAFVQFEKRNGLIFVECKIVPISLLHASQLLGYSRVALPLVSLLISSQGIGSSLTGLLLTYGRMDIIEYHWEKGKQPLRMVLARWDEATKSVDSNTILPRGEW